MDTVLNELKDGIRRFRTEIYPKNEATYLQAVSEPQRPHSLIVTCADSRIDIETITQSGPGDIFVTRNVGNLVPAYGEMLGGVSAVIEYAVTALKVQHVVICGHTDCGVMKGVLNPEALKPLANVSAWLSHAQPAREALAESAGSLSESEFLLALTERNVVEQLKNLHTHPSVAARLEQGNLKLHGWVYHIGRGIVTTYSKRREKFIRVRTIKPRKKTGARKSSLPAVRRQERK